MELIEDILEVSVPDKSNELELNIPFEFDIGTASQR